MCSKHLLYTAVSQSKLLAFLPNVVSQIRTNRWDDKRGSYFFDELLFYGLPRDCPYGERKEKETESGSQNNHTNGLMQITLRMKNLHK